MITHEKGREAMMFLGDHWIGTEPYGKYFAGIGLDAVVGSVGSGVTLRMISDIKGVDLVILKLLKSNSTAPILYDVFSVIKSAISKDSSHSLNNLVNRSFIFGTLTFV